MGDGDGYGYANMIPHNPMINAGAMMTVSMVYPEFDRETRLKKVMEIWRELSAGLGGDDPIDYNHEMYLSESRDANQNWALAYMMAGANAFPPAFHDKGQELIAKINRTTANPTQEALKETLELNW